MAWLRSAWTALLDRAPQRLPALAAATAIITAVTTPGALRDVGIAVTVMALLSKEGACACTLFSLPAAHRASGLVAHNGAAASTPAEPAV